MLAWLMLLNPLSGDAADVPVIPLPNRVVVDEGRVALLPQLSIRFDPRLQEEARWLAGELGLRLGRPVIVLSEELGTATEQELRLDLREANGPAEGYLLRTGETRIDILGQDAAGAFYGAQTLLQLLGPGTDPDLPRVMIEDAPRFPWRGLHLDVGRHFFPVERIEELLDLMALHKLNTFHWHLTEDQGWRIAIRAWPKLTEVGAWRASTPPYGHRKGADGVRYGGFYTQDDVRRVVAYAAARHITVVPEIDMPGHMSAAIAAYPELGNDDIEGFRPEVQTAWGVHPYILAPKEQTFAFLDSVLEEVCELFPSKRIHIGGDEARKDQWVASKFANRVMAENGLEDPHALQGWFLKRVSGMLEKRGRDMVGWDEIAEGGLAPGAVVMAWRGWDAAVQAAQAGHDVVMAPTSHTYLDYYQAPAEGELARGVENECIGGMLPLDKVYGMEPVPEALRNSDAARHILGCQGQLWTEYLKTWDRVTVQAFPRVCALAEVAWTQPDSKDFAGFQRRLEPMLNRLEARGVRVWRPATAKK
ncbi:MAG: beta-N-acetylhexosaminidase [Planctomycetota bacterium]